MRNNRWDLWYEGGIYPCISYCPLPRDYTSLDVVPSALIQRGPEGGYGTQKGGHGTFGKGMKGPWTLRSEVDRPGGPYTLTCL